MVLIDSIQQLKDIRRAFIGTNTIGFVPTMGALHQGHLSLIEQAKLECDLVFCSIFVNPTQFDKVEDLTKYPRTLDQDLELLQTTGVDYVFSPKAEEVYKAPYFLRFDFGELERVMEGKFRVGHFNGVATVVSKLFHLISPNKAYFGQKDLQQVAIIKDLVKALSFDIEVIRCKIVRDINGLALSSRNARLSDKERVDAQIIYQTVSKTILLLKSGLAIEKSLEQAIQFFKKHTGFEPEYLEIVDANTLQTPQKIQTSILYAVCIATPFGKVRLIDNELFSL